jgi:hypothetical protein
MGLMAKAFCGHMRCWDNLPQQQSCALVAARRQRERSARRTADANAKGTGGRLPGATNGQASHQICSVVMWPRLCPPGSITHIAPAQCPVPYGMLRIASWLAATSSTLHAGHQGHALGLPLRRMMVLVVLRPQASLHTTIHTHARTHAVALCHLVCTLWPWEAS